MTKTTGHENQESRETIKDDIYKYDKLILNIPYENKNMDVGDYSLVLLQEETEPAIPNECFFLTIFKIIQLKFAIYESPNSIISYGCSSESYT